jgi:hypothetical protein
MGISTFPAASAGGVTARTLKQKVFNTSGTFTYPSSSNFDGTVEVTVVAGGGAGGACTNRSGGAYYVGAGAGGGGQVILKKQLSILGNGNQSVTVGEGGSGYYEAGGLFGHISSFGNGYVRNLYPDPELTKGLLSINANVGGVIYPETRNGTDGVSINNPNFWSSGTNPPQPPVGKTYVSLNLSGNAPVYSQYMSVKASTSYRIIFSHTFNSSGGQTVTPYIMWFNTDGSNISDSTLTSFTTQSSSGTWTAVTSTVTSPAGAVYGRIYWLSGSSANYRISGIQVAETAAGVTTVISGSSSGYTWTGISNNSYTVGENETLVAAQGGGGGWGLAWRISSSGSSYLLPGHAGYTAGGLGLSNGATSIASTQIFVSGSGGGAGGNAKGPVTPTQTAATDTYLINNGEVHSARYGFQTVTDGNHARFHAAIHSSAAYVGSDSILYAKGSSNVHPAINFGENGSGIEGYGYGGVGAARAGTQYDNYFMGSGSGIAPALTGFGSDFSPTSNLHQAAYRGKNNSGNGGSGWIGSVPNNSADHNGPSGGSGVVIVRWYE